jgi:Fe-S cluster assembly iron-binding protein IscA
MLTLTQEAAGAIRQLTSAAPPGAGVRLHIGSMLTGGQPAPIEIEVVPWSDTRDTVLESAGARLYVEPETLRLLDHKLLDAEVAGAETRFALLEQPDLEFA